jgi:oligosaccharide reducing-end xylanase
MKGAFYTGEYRNVFAEYGYSPAEINKRVAATYEEMFHGAPDRVLFHADWPDMASFEDTGNVDARTEGMSYSMMMAVQMDRQEDFDKLWKF